MTANLWVVGDSFVLPNMTTMKWIDEQKAWPYILGKNLQTKHVSVIGQYGCSNNYLCHEIIKNSPHISANDYMVVVTTSATRNWFFAEHPQIANHNAVYNKLISKQQEKAIEYYYTYLHDNEEDWKISLENMIAWCHIFAQRKNVKLVVIPCFEWNHLHNCNEGSLYYIDAQEHGGWENKQKWLDKINKKDIKDCHLSPENHIVLANKFTDYFLRKTTIIDLTTDFVKDIF